MKKHIIWLVPLLIVGTAFSASAAGEGEAGADTVYEYDVAATNMHRRNPELNMTKRWLDEYFNIKINWVVTENQFEKLNVLLAAGEVPDMIAMRLNPVQLATYADQGVLAELPVESIQEVMPEYYAHVASFGDPRVWKYGEIGGKHMGLPIISPWNVYRRGIAWNAQWLYNVGITKVPETLDEFEAAFMKFRHEDPNQSGSKDTYAFTAPGDQETAPAGFFQEIFGAHGTFAFQWIEKDGELQYGFTDPGTKEALALLADWYAREIIDPEWVTEIGRKDGANDVSWKFANEKIGYVSSLGSDDSEWDGGGHLNRKWHTAHPEHRSYIYTDPDCWPDDCSGKGHYSIIAFTEIDPAAHADVTDYHPYINAEPPIGPRGDAGMSVRGLQPLYVAFGRQLEQEQAKYGRMLQVLNSIATDRELYYSAALGCFVGDTTEVCKEATPWHWIPWDGSEYGNYFGQTDEWLADPRRQGELGQNLAGGFSTNPFWVYAPWYNVSRGAGGVQRQMLYDSIASQNTVEQPLKVALPSQAEYADVDKVLKEFFYKVILGTQSVDDYDSVVAEWRRNGGDVLTQEANEWFATVK